MKIVTPQTGDTKKDSEQSPVSRRIFYFKRKHSVKSVTLFSQSTHT